MTDKIANQLWARASQCNEEGMADGPIEDRHRVIEQLRRVANQLEAEPEAIKGLIFVAGIETSNDGDQVGMEVMSNVMGCQHGVAAAFLQVKDTCEKALTAATGPLLMEALVEALQGIDFEEVLKDAKLGEHRLAGVLKFKR